MRYRVLIRSCARILAVGSLVALATSCFPEGDQGDTDAPLQQAVSTPDSDRHIVKFRDAQLGKSAVLSAGAALQRDLPQMNAAAYRIPAAALDGLRNHPAIEYIERDQPRYPMAQTSPYGISAVQADQLTEGSPGNRMVCIIDSGYDINHEDLRSSGVTGYASGTGNWYEDGCAHGTHVAGTIAAVNNTLGVIGVTPAVDLHIIKVFGDDCAWTYSSDLVDAAYRCRDAGANIISMSLGCSGGSGPFGCSSSTEDAAFQDLYDNYDILSIAAAGNDGNTALSYPASYASVVSVAAIDEAKAVADFSQQNAEVELAAPGVAVLSTVPMGAGYNTQVSVAGAGYEAAAMQDSPYGTASGALVDCGIGDSVCTGAAGGVCLIQRGTISFAEKVQNCEAGGGVAAIIYNNVAGVVLGTMNGTVTGIPSVGASDTTGATLLGQLGQSAAVTVDVGNYDFFNGTSMATPHVSGVAALVWSQNTAWSAQQIRAALAATAEDLGAAGRDNAYGYGLVQAKAAVDYLNDGGGDPGDPGDPGDITLSTTGYKVKGFKTADLSWSGATSTNVDIYRDGALIATTSNDGAYTDNLNQKGSGTHTHQVCEAGTTTCSSTTTTSF